MKASLIEPEFFEVVDGETWYTASRREDGSLFVMNHRGTVIREQSAVHKRVAAAVAAIS